MSALPYMPLYISDYLADAAHLSTIEHGAYLLLIMTYWQRGEPLPNDDKRLARIARMTPDEWADARDTVAEFFIEKDTVWTHKRIDAELKHVAERSKRAKNAGKASAKRRSEVSENIDDSNTRSTDAQRTLNVRSTDAAVPLNHTDTYRKKERKTPPMPPKQNDEPVSAIAKLLQGWLDLQREIFASTRVTPSAADRTAAAAIAVDLADTGITAKQFLAAARPVLENAAAKAQPIKSLGYLRHLAEDLAAKSVAKTVAKADKNDLLRDLGTIRQAVALHEGATDPTEYRAWLDRNADRVSVPKLGMGATPEDKHLAQIEAWAAQARSAGVVVDLNRLTTGEARRILTAH